MAVVLNEQLAAQPAVPESTALAGDPFPRRAWWHWIASVFAPTAAYAIALAAAGHAATTAIGLGVAASLTAGSIAWQRHTSRPALAGMRTGASARMFEALVMVGALATLLTLVEPKLGSPTEWALGTAGALAAFATARVTVDRRTVRQVGHVPLRRVVIVGGEDDADRLRSMVEAHPRAGWDVVAVVPEHGVAGRLMETARATRATSIVVAAHALRDEALRMELALIARTRIDVHIDAGLHGFDPRRVRVAPLGHDPLLTLRRPQFRPLQLALKRTSDIVLASILLVIALPVMAVAIVAIKLDDHGPAFFAQTRVGRNGRTFRLLKLRTMHTSAEAQLAQLRHLNERDGPLFKLADDPRVTRVGKLLRATSIDELPQLFHVIGGSMSLVGPRPALPSEAATFDVRLANRHDVRPGITGLWQVEQRDSALFSAYRELDVFYVENWALMLDMAILVHTLPAVAGRAWRSLRRAH